MAKRARDTNMTLGSGPPSRSTLGTRPCKKIRPNIVTLKEENPHDFGRFIMALKHLEESEDWPRICGIHGNTFKPKDACVLCPTDPLVVTKLAKTGEPFYCAHSVEAFIAWHVPYLFEYERLLNLYNRSTDKSFLPLPYFDISEQQNVDYTFLSSRLITILYENEYITLRNPLAHATFYPNGVKTPIQRNGFLQASTPKEFKQLKTIRRQLYDTLHAETYEEFSSQVVSTLKQYQPYGYVPLETPHNSIHNIIGGKGGNMTSVEISAFDPIFWLHHCNMDRFFYTWLKNVGYDSKVFSVNSLNATLAPFFPKGVCDEKNGWQNNTGQFMLLREVLEFVKESPYTYEPVILKKKGVEKAYIDLVDIPIPRETMTIHAYLYPKTLDLTVWNKDDWYAGSVAWFGINRNETVCERCERVRTSLKIDVLDFMQQCAAENVEDFCFYIEGEGQLIRDTNGDYKMYSMEEIVKDGTVQINI